MLLTSGALNSSYLRLSKGINLRYESPSSIVEKFVKLSNLGRSILLSGHISPKLQNPWYNRLLILRTKKYT